MFERFEITKQKCNMIRAVLDTNVLLSALISLTGSPAKIYALWKEGGCFELVASRYILDEFYTAASQKLNFSDVQLAEVILSVQKSAEIVEPFLLRHDKILPNDWPILGTAIAGGADFLVTGDKKILNLKNYQGAKIITPKQFLDILKF